MNVKVDYLFSKNHKIGSKLIRWGTAFLSLSTKKIPSHVALLINNKWVIESTLESGFRVISYNKWKSFNIELFKLRCIQGRTFKEIKELYKPLKNKKYDYLGVIYFSWRIALMKFLGIPKPKKNLFEHKDKYFCCEVISKMTGVSYEMTAPVELLVKIQNALDEFKN